MSSISSLVNDMTPQEYNKRFFKEESYLDIEVCLVYFLNRYEKAAIVKNMKNQKIEILHREAKIHRCDKVVVQPNAYHTTLKDMNLLIEKLKEKHEKTKNMNTKWAIEAMTKYKNKMIEYIKENHV